MTRSQVDMLLSNYKSNTSRRKHIIAEIARLEKEIARIEDNVVYLSSSRITGDPKSSDPGDATAIIAISLASGDTPGTDALRATLDRLEREKLRIEQDIAYVNIWLKALSERERLVLSSNVIDGLCWRAVANVYDRNLGMTACEATLRSLKKSALSKIYAIAG